VREDLAFELAGFDRRRSDPAGEAAQHESRGELVRV
jgi:hypothetical protein